MSLIDLMDLPPTGGPLLVKDRAPIFLGVYHPKYVMSMRKVLESEWVGGRCAGG